MDSVTVIVYAASLLIGISELAYGNLQLESVQVIFRHGDRTPDKREIYPKMPHNPLYDQLGYGQLTEKGKKRELHLGKLLRARYDQFLGPTPNYGDVYAVSTDYDRTKMSLQLVLAGLYPPVGGNNVGVNAVSIMYYPKIVDVVLQPLYCRRYVQELINVKKSPAVTKLITMHIDFFNYLGENTGMDMSEDPILRTSALYQLTMSEESMGVPLPGWATEEVRKRLERVAMLDYELQSFTPYMKRMYGGHLVKEVIENMDANSSRGAKTKIWLYSGHEINIAAFAKAHGLAIPIPHYGATIIVEKWRFLSQEFVQMLHWTGDGDTLTIYKLPLCTTMCPYKTYKVLMKNVLPTKEDADCLWNSVTKDDLRSYYRNERNIV